MILSISQGVCFGTKNADGKVCIGDTSLRKYMSKNIKSTSNLNKITRGRKKCIIEMLLKSDLNKSRVSQLSGLDQVYTNSDSIRSLQISKIDLVEYNS